MKFSVQCIIFMFWGVLIAQTPEPTLLVNIHNVTTSEMNAISNPETGSLIYNTDDEKLYEYDGSQWIGLVSDGNETFIQTGNSITNITGDGTTSNPYLLSVTQPTFTDNNDGTYTFSNGIDPDITIGNASSPKVLDNLLSNISFALSFRQLVQGYTGPLVRLRRASDNAEMDFFPASGQDLIDINAINTWRSGNNVFVTTWYDQSGLSRNAVQPSASIQPQFIPDTAQPYLVGNGSGQRLDVNTSIQTLTNAGANGTILCVSEVTRRSQFSFGSTSGSNRWASHMNWSNNQLYFDPGICCNSPRSFVNSGNVNQLKQYTFIRGNSTVTVRQQNSAGFSGNHTTGRCTINNNFGILYANGSSQYSNNKFSEFIMYNTDISSADYNTIETNQISFWNL